MTTTTRSSVPSEVPKYAIYLGVTNDAGRLGAIQFKVRWVGGGGGWVGAGAYTRCSPLVETALATFNDVGHGVVRGAMIDLNGIPTPGEIAKCEFRSEQEILPESFEVTVEDAATPDVNTPPREWPVMAVTRVESVP